jgi:hypothetical protein
VYRVIAGQIGSISIDVAADIEVLTAGAVPVTSWRTTPAVTTSIVDGPRPAPEASR